MLIRANNTGPQPFNYITITINIVSKTIDNIHDTLQKEVFHIRDIKRILVELDKQHKELQTLIESPLTEEEEEVIKQLGEKIISLTEQANILLHQVNKSHSQSNRCRLQARKQSTALIAKTIKIPENLPDDSSSTFPFDFLSFDDLANCLRVSKFFQKTALQVNIFDQGIFLNKEKTIYFNLLSLKSNPTTVDNILHARRNAFACAWFWQTEKKILDKVPEKLKKLKSSLVGPA